METITPGPFGGAAVLPVPDNFCVAAAFNLRGLKPAAKVFDTHEPNGISLHVFKVSLVLLR